MNSYTVYLSHQGTDVFNTSPQYYLFVHMLLPLIYILLTYNYNKYQHQNDKHIQYVYICFSRFFRRWPKSWINL